jgi:predicted SAM-dependent methyltransferase
VQWLAAGRGCDIESRGRFEGNGLGGKDEMILEKLRQIHDYIYLSFDFPANTARVPGPGRFDKIHYACGTKYFENWLNVDIRPIVRVPKRFQPFYLKMSLTRRHPFADGALRFGYSEDFIEHLSQSDSLIFLSEVYRTLAPDGVVRISTPGLRGVLSRHYRSTDFVGAKCGEVEAFTQWGHLHFYSEESLTTVATHLGFRKIEFKRYNESDYYELRTRETRPHQIDLNIVAELTK